MPGNHCESPALVLKNLVQLGALTVRPTLQRHPHRCAKNVRAPANTFFAFPAHARLILHEQDFDTVHQISSFGSLHAPSMNELRGVCTSTVRIQPDGDSNTGWITREAVGAKLVSS